MGTSTRRYVIVGNGFAGTTAAEQLRKQLLVSANQNVVVASGQIFQVATARMIPLCGEFGQPIGQVHRSRGR